MLQYISLRYCLSVLLLSVQFVKTVQGRTVNGVFSTDAAKATIGQYIASFCYRGTVPRLNKKLMFLKHMFQICMDL